YFDVSIALIEGWQKFDDGLRTDSPLVTARQWRGLLSARGFAELAVFPPTESAAEVLGSHVIVARGPSIGTQERHERPAAMTPAIKCGLPEGPNGESSAEADNIARQLEESPS